MYRFYEMQGNKDLNHVWKAVLAFGFQDLLKGIANTLKRGACYYPKQPTLTLMLLSSWPRLPIGSNWPVPETATMLPRIQHHTSAYRLFQVQHWTNVMLTLFSHVNGKGVKLFQDVHPWGSHPKASLEMPQNHHLLVSMAVSEKGLRVASFLEPSISKPKGQLLCYWDINISREAWVTDDQQVPHLPQETWAARASRLPESMFSCLQLWNSVVRASSSSVLGKINPLYLGLSKYKLNTIKCQNFLRIWVKYGDNP